MRDNECLNMAQMTPLERWALCAILLVYGLVGMLYVLYTPAWQAPDEPAHYNYVAQVAAVGCCPQITPGDWDQAYQNQLTGARFAPELLDNLSSLQYEDHQPPLYYVLASGVYKLTGGSLSALRLFSLLIGVLVILSAYSVGKLLLPDRPQVALGMAAVVAYLPQHLAFLASVNNDSLGWAVIGITLTLTLAYLKSPVPSQRWVVVLGLLVGVGFITKASTYFLAGVVPLAMVLKWRIERQNLSLLLQRSALFLLPALLLGGLWWARNFNVYGFPDFLGLRAHDAVVADQPRTADRIAEIGWGPYLSQSIQTTFNSFWGQFGWMALPMPGWVYSALTVLLLAAAGGWVIDQTCLRANPQPRTLNGQTAALLILALTALLALLQYLYYNTEFLQLQGRYLFSGLVPFAFWLVAGVDTWRRWLWQRLPLALVWGLFALLDGYLLWKFIVPLLSP